MPTIAGSITLSDLLDGVTGASVVLSNETHTFAATADGEITTANLAGFLNDTTVFIGVTSIGFDPDGTVGSNMFDYTGNADTDAGRRAGITIVPSNSGIQANVSSTGTITIEDVSSGATGFADAGTMSIDSITLNIPVRVNNAGTVQTYNRTISLTKARGGSARVIRITTSRQTVTYAFDTATPKTQDDIVIVGDFQNFETSDADAVWTFSNDGSVPTSTVPTSRVSTDVIVNDTLTLTAANFNSDRGANQQVTYRLTRATRYDQVTVVRLVDAEGGYQVLIETDESTVFRNNVAFNAGDDSTFADLSARLFRGGLEVSTGLTYQWQKDGANYSPLNPQPTGFGATSASIRLGANDVDDNKNNLFTNQVTF